MSLKDMMAKSKLLYGQTRGRIPIMLVMFLLMGCVFTAIGFKSIQSEQGYFPLGLGVLFFILAVLAMINQKRSGLRT